MQIFNQGKEVQQSKISPIKFGKLHHIVLHRHSVILVITDQVVIFSIYYALKHAVETEVYNTTSQSF